MKAVLARALEFVKRGYFTVDARSLALFRVLFGLHLIANLFDRTSGPDAIAFYTNLGVLPNHYALYAPLGDHIWSLLFPFSKPAEVQVAFAVILLVYIAYVIGYRTKWAQIGAVVCLLSLTNRNLMLQNGGIVVTNLVALWTSLLPLGARFSIDHLRRSLRERDEGSATTSSRREATWPAALLLLRVAFFGILLNFACIYFFNYAHKRGTTWHDGSAVHWVLWQNRINTIWAAFLRMHEPPWLSPVLTRGTLIIEAAIPVLLLSPFATKWTRRGAIACIWALHSGISLMMTLGPFSYSMMAFSLLLVGREDWELVRRAFAWRGPPSRYFVIHLHVRNGNCPVCSRASISAARSRSPRAGPRPRPTDEPQFGCSLRSRWGSRMPGSRACPVRVGQAESSPRHLTSLPPREVRAAREIRLRKPSTRKAPGGRSTRRRPLGNGGDSDLSDNWAIADRYRIKQRPPFVRELVDYLRVPQGWSMFSPDAPRDDGTLVIDAILSDGRHLDPRKQRPPDFEAAFHGPWFDDQQWCDWDLRMKFDGNRHFYPNFRDYIARLDKLKSWKQEATIVSFEVYWVNNAAPPPGSTTPYDIRKQLLFTSTSGPK